MKQILVFILILFLSPIGSRAQQIIEDNPLDPSQRRSGFENDSTETTDVPEGLYAWTVDSRFGDIRPTGYDTIPHRFQNENSTSGYTGHYNYTGNLGAPRISHFFNEQGVNMQTNPFIFKLPYDYFLKSPEGLLYTNTKSPFTTLTYHSCGNKTNGEDRLKGIFAVNAGKKFGMGFNVDYLYGRGYYEAQSTADINAIAYASYRGEKYQMHAFAQHTYLKTRENGGIESDEYVTRPESFPTSYGTADIPINLAKAWNKIGGKQIFLTHRYNLGFHRYRDERGKIIDKDLLPKMWGVKTEKEIPTDSLLRRRPLSSKGRKDSATNIISPIGRTDSTAVSIQPRGIDNDDLSSKEEQDEADSLKITAEFVPVTSFIHTLRINQDTRRFQSHVVNNESSPGFFDDFFLPGDSANDHTKHLGIENTLAFELHEGFNKWMKMGMKLYAKHSFSSFKFDVPYQQLLTSNTLYRENHVTVGAQLLSQQSRIIRYDVLGEIRTSGTKWGEFNIEGNATLNIPMKRDSLHFDLNGFVRNEEPSFYYRHYHGRNAWWDNEGYNKVFRARVNGTLRYKETSLSASLENIQNYLYFQESLTQAVGSGDYPTYRHAVNPVQASQNIQLLGVTLAQNVRAGIFNWENEVAYQVSSQKGIYPVPTFSAYTNIYILFRIAKVLRTEIGADLRYFTRYYAPAYSPIIGQYAVQDANYRTKIGNYPIINVYANFHLKRTRFYLMASHVNYSSGSGDPFLVPHYPINRLVIHFGLSWNFVN